MKKTATLLAGVPAVNATLFHRTRLNVGDPAAIIETVENGQSFSTFIVRDIEMDRARRCVKADRVACPADYAPQGGLSGDRETATAQAVAEFLRRASVQRVIADRTLPLIFSYHIQEAGIAVEYDEELGVRNRRSKDEQEIEWLAEAQSVTEGAMRMACEMVARADVRSDGVLLVDAEPLTSERVRTAIDIWLLERGFTNPGAIVAGGSQGGDCHALGSGELRTGESVIVDIFPCSRETHYNGDCTRTVVHGEVSQRTAQFHAAVVAAKAAGIAATGIGVPGEDVHKATIDVIRAHGFEIGLPPEGAPLSYATMPHGTGHGVGLNVHEPPLLDFGGPPLVVGDALTIEPGIYCYEFGGVRIEDMVIVTEEGCRNLNTLSEGLCWK